MRKIKFQMDNVIIKISSQDEIYEKLPQSVKDLYEFSLMFEQLVNCNLTIILK